MLGGKMQVIHKYDIKIGYFSLILTKKARILTVQVQRGTPRLWVMLNLKHTPKMRHFRVVGTGYDIKERNFEYLGTFQLTLGSLVYHLLEVKEAKAKKLKGL